MAWTFGGVLSATAGNGANCTIDSSVFGAGTGDIILVWGGHSNTGQPAGPTSGGMTGFNEIFQTTSSVRFSAHYKVLTASDTVDDIVCLGSGNTNDSCAYQACYFQGGDISSPLDTTYTISEATGEPNSPSITTATNQAIVLSLFGLAERKTIHNSGPTGYSGDAIQGGIDDVNDFTVGFAYKEIATAGAENPGPWDLSGAVTAGHQAASVALRISQGSVVDSPLSATGTGTATFTATSTSAQPFSMTGTGTAAFIDGSFTTAPAVFSATGTGTLAFVAAVTQTAVAAMTGTGTASLVGASNANSLGSMTGTVTPTFGGGSINNIVGTMTGTGTASFVNSSLSVGGGAFEAAGTGTASFAAQPFDSRPFSMTGTNTSAFVGVPLATQGPFTMTGTGTALFVGTLQGQGNLAATGTADIDFKGGSINGRAFRLNGVTGTVNFVGARDRLSHIRETIESRGAVSVSIN